MTVRSQAPEEDEDIVWGRRLAVFGATALVALVAPMAPAPAQDEDEVLLDDLGPGWSPTTCPPISGPVVGSSVCFASEDRPGDVVGITASPAPAGTVASGIVASMAEALGGTPFETEGLPNAEGRISRVGGGGRAIVIVMIAGEHLFLLDLVTAAPPRVGAAVLLEVARRQQQVVGVPSQPPETVEVTTGELDRLLIAPPSGSWLEITATIDIPLDLEQVRSEARSQAVVDLLSDAPSRTRVFSSGGLPVATVTLTEYPYDHFAAAALGALHPRRADLGIDTSTVPDAIGLRLPVGTGEGIAFRRGPYLVIVMSTSAAAGRGVSAAELLGLARLQAGRLPDGDTGPYFFPSAATSISLTAALTTALCGVALGSGRLAAAWRRGGDRSRRRRVDATAIAHTQVADVTRAANALRRRGLVLVIVDLVAVNVLVVGTLGLTGVLQMPAVVTLVLLGGGGLAGIAFTAWWARSELRRTRADARAFRELRPSLSGAVGALVSFVLLVGGLAVVASALAGLAFGPSLGDLERSKRFGIDPTHLSVALLVAGAVALVAGGFGVRLARMWARASGRRVRARDRRPPILYLRSFEDDGLRLPAVVSARRPFLELFAARGADPFEEALAWQLAPYGPVVAVARPGRSAASLGAARDHLPDDAWREEIARLMAASFAIVVVLGATDGLRWELSRIVLGGHVERTVFVFPPTMPETVRARWRSTEQVFAALGLPVPALPAPAEHVIAAVLNPSGGWRISVAEVRDEATFRAAVDQAMQWLAGAGHGLPTGSVAPAVVP